MKDKSTEKNRKKKILNSIKFKQNDDHFSVKKIVDKHGTFSISIPM